MTQTAVGAFLVAAFTATWGNVQVAIVQAADVFLVLTLMIVVAMVVFGDFRFIIPGWIWAPVAPLILCVVVRSFDPVPPQYYAARFQTADVQPDSVVKAVFWVFAFVGVPVAAIACTALEPRVPKWAMASFLGGVALSCLVALTDVTGLTSISSALGYQSNNSRQIGLAGHPNTLGIVCVFAAPIAVYFIGESRRKWIPCIALMLLFCGVLLSGSRGAQAILPLGLLLATYFSAHRKQILGWLTGVIVCGMVVGAVILETLAHGTLEEVFRFKTSAANLSGDAGRLILVTQAWHDFKQFPIFGVGIKHIAEAHNIYLEVLSTGGIVLAIGMFVYWLGTIHSCRVARRRGELLASFVMISILAWLLVGVVENQLTDRYLYYTVGCVAALASGMRVRN